MTDARGLPAELARALLALLGSLLLLAHAPVLLGWTSATVVSGSMAPRLQAGDVLVVSPVRPEQLAVGQVLLVDDPVRPGELLSHRLVQIGEDGMLVLRGDANQGDDTARVALSAVHGAGRLRVPLVGLPVAWLAQGRHLAVLGTSVLLLLALVLGLGSREAAAAAPSGPTARPGAARRGRSPRRARPGAGARLLR